MLQMKICNFKKKNDKRATQKYSYLLHKKLSKENYPDIWREIIILIKTKYL